MYCCYTLLSCYTEFPLHTNGGAHLFSFWPLCCLYLWILPISSSQQEFFNISKIEKNLLKKRHCKCHWRQIQFKTEYEENDEFFLKNGISWRHLKRFFKTHFLPIPKTDKNLNRLLFNLDSIYFQKNWFGLCWHSMLCQNYKFFACFQQNITE